MVNNYINPLRYIFFHLLTSLNLFNKSDKFNSTYSFKIWDSFPISVPSVITISPLPAFTPGIVDYLRVIFIITGLPLPFQSVTIFLISSSLFAWDFSIKTIKIFLFFVCFVQPANGDLQFLHKVLGKNFFNFNIVISYPLTNFFGCLIPSLKYLFDGTISTIFIIITVGFCSGHKLGRRI